MAVDKQVNEKDIDPIFQAIDKYSKIFRDSVKERSIDDTLWQGKRPSKGNITRRSYAPHTARSNAATKIKALVQ